MLIGNLNDQALEYISAYDWKALGLQKSIDLLKARFDKHNLESVSQSEFYSYKSYKKRKKKLWPEDRHHSPPHKSRMMLIQTLIL